jgi:hypothetical protein
MWAWANICIENKFGRLGVQNLQALNQALILLGASGLAKEPQSQLALILKENYTMTLHMESQTKQAKIFLLGNNT